MKLEVPCTYKYMMESMFECSNRALKSRENIIKFSENGIEMDGIDGKDNERTSDGELV